MFRKYDHVERIGHPEIQDLDVGVLHIFPKLDGTNASIWAEVDVDQPGADLTVRCGSRNRALAEGSDNHGFRAWVFSDDPNAVALREFVLANPNLIVYGEWQREGVIEEFVAKNRHRLIPRFLGTLHYEFVQEEIRTIIKKWKNPMLDLSRVNKLLTIRAKQVLVEVF